MEFVRVKFIMALMLSLLYANLAANIDGIKIMIVEAKLYGTVHIPLVDKRIKSKNSIFNLGQTVASRATKKLYKDDEFYILSIEDKNSKGKLHAIVKGSYLKRYPHYINALTEVSFLLSQEFIGKKYNKVALEENLDRIAKKMIKRKGFVLDNSFEIDYSDVLLYENGSKVLYKSYSEYIKSLESKIKENTLTYKDAFEYVYKKKDYKKVSKKSTIKKIVPLYRLVVFLHIAKNTKIGTEIVKLEILREGSASVENFEIRSANIPFKISKKGSVTLSRALRKESYSFEAVAHTKDGDSNKISFTIVIDKIKEEKYYKVKELK